MKKRDIEKKLKSFGWWMARHGGNHDIWTNGEITNQVPRHNEVKEMLGKSIIRKAQENPAKER